jgi:hypothetical protein
MGDPISEANLSLGTWRIATAKRAQDEELYCGIDLLI